MKKKLLLTLALTCISFCAFGILCVSAATYGDLTYTVSNGEVKITECDKSATEVVVPETIEGFPVTAIGSSAFSNCISLTYVKLPDSITTIRSNAFYKCTQLNSIILQDGITTIGYDAFYDTGYYNNGDNWENDILYINNYLIKAKNTFCGVCHIKEGTWIISVSAFEDCTGLKSVIVPDSVISIGNYAFRNCNSLTSITMGKGVVYVGDSAFDKCTNINDVYISDIVEWCKIDFYCAASNPLLYAENLYLNGELVRVFEISSSVSEIGTFAFANYDNLINVVLPHGIRKIGAGAFNSCHNLININIPDSVEFIGNSAFLGCTSLNSIELPDSVTDISIGSFAMCSSLTEVVLSSSLTNIPMRAFEECSSLTNITIPHTVKNIYYKAFENCNSLETVSYNGTEEDWNSVVIGTGNDYLINSAVLYIPRIEVFISDNGVTFTVNPINIKNGKAIILALYNGEKFVEFKKNKIVKRRKIS